MLVELYHPTEEECLAGGWLYFSNGYVQVIDSKHYYWKRFDTSTEAIQKVIASNTWHSLCRTQSSNKHYSHTFSNPIFSITINSFDDLRKIHPEYYI